METRRAGAAEGDVEAKAKLEVRTTGRQVRGVTN